MTKEEAINTIIASGCDTNKISDGYHTFGELYEHRIELFVTLCRTISDYKEADGLSMTIMKGFSPNVWRSLKHSDGNLVFGGEWFILGIGRNKGEQITYHLPIRFWDFTNFADTLELAPEFDGHTSQDVLSRLKEL